MFQKCEEIFSLSALFSVLSCLLVPANEAGTEFTQGEEEEAFPHLSRRPDEEKEEEEEGERKRMITDPLEWLGTSSPS